MIVAIEGIDASGKQTQSKALVERLVANGVSAVRHDFPHYQGRIGSVIGRVLRGETMIVTHDDLLAARDETPPDVLDLDRLAGAWSRDKAFLIQAAMLADRHEHIELLLDYQHDRRRVLVLDRYVTSAYVYGSVDGLPDTWLRTVHLTLPKPSLQFFLDISVEESCRRRPDRRDYYEHNLEKLQRVRKAYAYTLINKHDYSLDGTRPPEELTDVMFHTVVQRLDETVRIRLERKP